MRSASRASGVRDETQIHTHMCYSEFNDIIAAIAAMDADVITIETIALGHGAAATRFDDFQLPERDRPGRLRHPLAARARRSDEIVRLLRKAADGDARRPACGSIRTAA